MELGQRIKQARLEAGLSQRQLCAEEITRNMLSQIENGSARPSMATLQYFASRLGKSVSYFLEEDTVTSPNQRIMESARESYIKKDFTAVRQLLQQYQGPDPVFDSEKGLMMTLSLSALAEQALAENRRPYALQLLQEAETAVQSTVYDLPQLHRSRQLLLARIRPEQAADILENLPADDSELILRAKVAMEQGEHLRAKEYLSAAQDRQTEEWYLLRGQAAMESGEYEQAMEYFRQVERSCPEQALPALERCCRELEDYKMAYFYACAQRERKEK